MSQKPVLMTKNPRKLEYNFQRGIFFKTGNGSPTASLLLSPFRQNLVSLILAQKNGIKNFLLKFYQTIGKTLIYVMAE